MLRRTENQYRARVTSLSFSQHCFYHEIQDLKSLPILQSWVRLNQYLLLHRDLWMTKNWLCILLILQKLIRRHQPVLKLDHLRNLNRPKISDIKPCLNPLRNFVQIRQSSTHSHYLELRRKTYQFPLLLVDI